jgi:hypothetical protein
MSHEELLWAIRKTIEYGPCESVGHWTYAKALYKVVLLHKPYESTDSGLLCRYEVDSDSPYHFYPCETISEIMKVFFDDKEKALEEIIKLNKEEGLYEKDIELMPKKELK